MAVATDLRNNLASALQQPLIDSGFLDPVFEIVAGMSDGPETDKDRGYIWTSTIEEDADEPMLEQIEVTLRIFKRFYVSREGIKPFDPTVLEDIGEFVQTTLRSLLAGLGPWHARVTGQDFLLDTQGVEITILGVHGNLALRAFS